MTISSRTGLGEFSRGSSFSVAGTRAGWREDSSGRCGGASIRSGAAAQASPGSRAAAGVAAGPGAAAGGGQPSATGMVSWSDPASSSSRCVVGVEARAGSASWAPTGAVKGEITHMCGLPCATHRQNTARPFQRSCSLNTFQNVLPPIVQKMGSLRLDFALGQPLWALSVCLAPTPPYKITCDSSPHPTPTSPTFSPLGFATLVRLQVIWPHVFNVGTVLQVGAGNLELSVEPGWLQGRCSFPAIHGPWLPRPLDGHSYFGPALALSHLAHLSITGGIWVGVSVNQALLLGWCWSCERRKDHPHACISMSPPQTEHSQSPEPTSGHPLHGESKSGWSEAGLCFWAAPGGAPCESGTFSYNKLACTSTCLLYTSPSPRDL